MNIDLDFLHNGLPARELRAERPRSSFPEPRLPSGISRTKEFEKLIGEYNICGQAFISEQYDHEVQAGSVVKPLTGAGRINTDAQVVAPVLGSRRGVVLSSALYPSYSLLNTYDMALASLDTAVRNAVSAGAKLSHLALLDNFCWCSSNEPKRLGELVEAVRGCYDGAVAYETPFISGKDSMFNDFSGFDEKGRPIKISIPPTLLISVIGVIPDVLKTVTPEFKTPGDAVYLLGETKNELGGSEYYKMLGSLGRRTPKVDLKRNLATYLAVERAIEGDFISSAVSLNSGGLAAALAKACIGGGFGIKAQVPGKAWIDSALFGESQGRILVSVRPENISRFEKIMKGVTFSRIGTVLGSDKITISMKQKTLVDTSIKKLRGIYHRFSDSMYEN